MKNFRPKVRQALCKFREVLDSQKETFTPAQVKLLRALTGGYKGSLRNLNSVLDGIESRAKSAQLFLSCLRDVGIDCSIPEFRELSLKFWSAETELAHGLKNHSMEVFVSHHPADCDWAAVVTHELRRRGCEVFASSHSEVGSGHDVDELRSSIERADCLLVLLKGNQDPERVSWAGRQVSLARHLQSVRQRRVLKNVYPFVAGLRRRDEFEDHALDLRLTLHAFDSGAPLESVHDFQASGVFDFQKDQPGEFIDALFRQFTYEVSHLKSRADFETHRTIFDGAMEIYEDLIPDPNERDPAGFIEKWICNNDGSPLSERRDERADWLDWLAVLHKGSKAHGALWCNIDRRTGIGEITFWGMESGFRSEGLAGQLVDTTLIAVADHLAGEVSSKDLRAIHFNVEPVDLSVFDTIRATAAKKAAGQLGLSLEETENLRFLKSEFDRESGKPFLLSEIEHYVADHSRAKELAEQLRRFRRLFFYTNADGRSKLLKERGWEIRAFVVSGDERPESDSDFSIYMQPPIREPEKKGEDVNDSQSCPFYLFALVNPKQGCETAAEALLWEYGSFLGDQYRSGKETALPGWDDYMVDFKNRFFGPFVTGSQLKRPKLGARYDSAVAILDLVKRMQRKSPILARLDITL